MHPEIYTAIFGALLKYENSPKTLQEILNLSPKNLDKQTLINGLIMLVSAGLIQPCKVLLSKIYDNPENEFNAELLTKIAFTAYQNLGIKHYKNQVDINEII